MWTRRSQVEDRHVYTAAVAGVKAFEAEGWAAATACRLEPPKASKKEWYRKSIYEYVWLCMGMCIYIYMLQAPGPATPPWDGYPPPTLW